MKVTFSKLLGVFLPGKADSTTPYIKTIFKVTTGRVVLNNGFILVTCALARKSFGALPLYRQLLSNVTRLSSTCELRHNNVSILSQ